MRFAPRPGFQIAFINVQRYSLPNSKITPKENQLASNVVKEASCLGKLITHQLEQRNGNRRLENLPQSIWSRRPGICHSTAREAQVLALLVLHTYSYSYPAPTSGHGFRMKSGGGVLCVAALSLVSGLCLLGVYESYKVSTS